MEKRMETGVYLDVRDTWGVGFRVSLLLFRGV